MPSARAVCYDSVPPLLLRPLDLLWALSVNFSGDDLEAAPRRRQRAAVPSNADRDLPYRLAFT